jgi:hypothetical protein
MAAGAQPQLPSKQSNPNVSLKFLRENIDWKISIVAVVGAIWALLQLARPGDLDLTVWIQQQIPISLPPQANALPVKLTYNGQAITQANVLQVSVINTGSKPLGESAPWTLVLKTRDGAKMVSLGKPTTRPDGIKVNVIDGPNPDRVALSMGLLNREDQVDFRLMILDPKQQNSYSLPIVAENPRIPHLSEPTITNQPLHKRLQNKIADSIMYVLVSIIFLGFLIYGVRTGELTQNFKSGATTVLGALFLALISGSLIALCLSWIAARVLLVASR